MAASEDQNFGRSRAHSNVTGTSTASSNKRLKNKVCELIKLIWDEFILCDPRSANKETQECPCGVCFSDLLFDELLNGGPDLEIPTSAKCKAIPAHLVFFC